MGIRVEHEPVRLTHNQIHSNRQQVNSEFREYRLMGWKCGTPRPLAPSPPPKKNMLSYPTFVLIKQNVGYPKSPSVLDSRVTRLHKWSARFGEWNVSSATRNSLVKSLFPESKTTTSGQDIPLTLQDPNVQYRVSNGPGLFKWSLPFTSPQYTPNSLPLSLPRYKRPVLITILHHRNNIWWTTRFMKLLAKKSSPISCYFLHLRPKYFCRHHSLQNSQYTFFISFYRPDFIPV